MIIDLSSPIEFRGYELLSDDNGTTRSYLKLYNITDRTITGYSATVRWSKDSVEDGATDHIDVDGIAIPGSTHFELMLTSSCAGADRIELYFAGVNFEDGGKWTPKDGALVDVGEQPVLTGKDAQILRETAGEDAIMYPQTQDKFWRCVCGRINLLTESECRRCRRDRGYVLKELNPKALGMTDGEKKKAGKRRKKAMRSVKRPEQAESDTALLIGIAVAAVLTFIIMQVLTAIL